ncbi:MAG: DUF547 domain-containing protein [Sedimentisphaerales bacterium]|nr:DUF547 domain-containing protein [Sedimentisphaerales bacterium]
MLIPVLAAPAAKKLKLPKGKKMTNWPVFFITLLSALIFAAGCQQPAPKPIKPLTVEPNTTEPNTPPIVQTSQTFHDICADILNNYVNDNGSVNYDMLRRKRSELITVLEKFDKLTPAEYNSWTKEDRIAFWINAYNMQMLNIIVKNYPIKPSRVFSVLWGPKSIRHIEGDIGGVWNNYKFIVMDEEFTLSDIEKRLFNKEFDEPRVLFALSRASLSGPPLRREPYYGHKLHSQLDDQTKKFLANPRGFRIDKNAGVVYLSALLQPTWFGSEFVSKYATDKKFKDKGTETRAVLNFITNYISPQDVSFLEVENYSVSYIAYDWTLNE